MSHGIGVRDGCEPPCESWELNLGPRVPLPVELSLQPCSPPPFLFLESLIVASNFKKDFFFK